MKSRKPFISIRLYSAFLAVVLLFCYSAVVIAEDQAPVFSYEEYPLERNGIRLHLDCMKLQGTEPGKNILLIHGVTYSSHEFDIKFQEELIRFLEE